MSIDTEIDGVHFGWISCLIDQRIVPISFDVPRVYLWVAHLLQSRTLRKSFRPSARPEFRDVKPLVFAPLNSRNGVFNIYFYMPSLYRIRSSLSLGKYPPRLVSAN